MNKQETAVQSLVDVMKHTPDINEVTPVAVLTHAKLTYETDVDPLVARNVIRYIKTFGEMGGAL